MHTPLPVGRFIRPFIVLAALVGSTVVPVVAQQKTPADSVAEAVTTADSLNVVADSTQRPARAVETAMLPTPMRASDLEAFLDGVMRTALNAFDIAGATVAVVRGDSLLLAKGYGYADMHTRQPVRAGETLFAIGSVSKLFVWTAVMQLVQQGTLDLNADVNTYLKDIQIPQTYPEPITLKHLMTHTAGFEDQVIGLFARDASRLRPLGEILREEMPARVRPPGVVASYSNHGTGLAAYIVEQVSGMAWDEYVETHILQPLGMGHTTFRQPVPAPLAASLSKGYTFADGIFEEQEFEFVPLAPVGAARSTATDMARFMQAHLGEGRLAEAVILDSTTARAMQEPLFFPAPEVNPLAHGFYELSRNGHRVLGHGGDTFWFHTLLALLPAYDVGLFVSFNSEQGGKATGEVYEAFMDRYFPPADVPELTPAFDARERMERFAGSYRSVRYSHQSIAKLAALFSTFQVSLTDNGRLQTSDGETIRWIQTGPLAFREEDGLRTLAFREDADGDVTHLLFGPVPVVAFERVGLPESPVLHGGVAALAILVFLLSFIGWPLAAWSRRRHGYQLEPQDRIPPAARFAVWAAPLLLLLFLAVLLIGLGGPTDIVYGIPQSVRVALWLPKVAAVLMILALVYLPVLWLKGWGRGGARLWYTLTTLVTLAFLAVLYCWNLLTFSL